MDNRQILGRLFGKEVEDSSTIPAEEQLSETETQQESPYAELSHTDRTIAENPMVRSMFWLVLVVGVAGAGLWVASNVDLSRANQTKRNTAKAETSDDDSDPAIKLDSTEANIAFSEQDVEQAQADGFLEAEQRAKDFDQAQQARDKANNQIANPPTPTSTPSTPRPVTPQNTVHIPQRPRSTPSPRPLRAYRPPVSPKASQPKPVTAPKPVSVTPPQPQPVEMDPYKLYASLDNVGSYGASNWGGNGEEQGQAYDDGFIDGTGGEVYLSSGQSVRMQLELPIIWSGNTEPEKALAIISEGSEALPTGTKIIVTAEGDSAGIVKVSQLQVLNDGSLIPLSGAMQITQGNGKPLVAKRKGGPGFFAKSGVKTLLGLAGNIAGNALSGDRVTVNTGSGSVSNDRGILSDVLQGGTDTLLGDLESRNQAAVQRQQSREYYIVPASETLVISAIEDIRS